MMELEKITILDENYVYPKCYIHPETELSAYRTVDDMALFLIDQFGIEDSKYLKVQEDCVIIFMCNICCPPEKI